LSILILFRDVLQICLDKPTSAGTFRAFVAAISNRLFPPKNFTLPILLGNVRHIQIRLDRLTSAGTFRAFVAAISNRLFPPKNFTFRAFVAAISNRLFHHAKKIKNRL